MTEKLYHVVATYPGAPDYTMLETGSWGGPLCPRPRKKMTLRQAMDAVDRGSTILTNRQLVIRRAS